MMLWDYRKGVWDCVILYLRPERYAIKKKRILIIIRWTFASYLLMALWISSLMNKSPQQLSPYV